MKNLIFCLLFLSCSNVEEKYIPQEIVTNDTITNIINDERIDKGLNELKSEKLLTELSKTKAIQMESEGKVNHNGFTNLEVHSEIFSQIAAYGFKSDLGLFNGYMASAEHKDKILGNYTHIGSYTYKSYNCILFAKY